MAMVATASPSVPIAEYETICAPLHVSLTESTASYQGTALSGFEEGLTAARGCSRMRARSTNSARLLWMAIGATVLACGHDQGPYPTVHLSIRGHVLTAEMV